MAWVSQGTVSVTNGSAEVVGAGTNWFGALQNGWGFVGPDGRAYEVLTVNSATSLTLRSNYQGSTASAQTYSVFPTSSLESDLAASVQALIANYSGVYNTVGQGRFPGDVVFDEDRDTGLNNPASNEVGLKAGGDLQLALKGGKARGAAVMQSLTDGEADRLLINGGHGLGGDAINLTDADDLDDLSASMFFRNGSIVSVPANSPYLDARWSGIHVEGGSNTSLQIVGEGNAEKLFSRVKAYGGDYSSWKEMYGAGDDATFGELTASSDFYLYSSSNDSYFKLNANGSGLFDFNPYSEDGSNKSSVRWFRGVNTTGVVSFDILQGNDTTGVNHRFCGNGHSFLCNFQGDLSVGHTTPGARLDVRKNSTSIPAGKFIVESGSFTGNAVVIASDRTASSAFDFMEMRSDEDGVSDIEVRFRGDGEVTATGSFTGGGADYAEFFEWLDGNPENEDRRGVSVVLVGNKIRPALAPEVPFGVISANPSVVGDGDIDRWKEKFLRDDFGAYIEEDYEVIQWSETVTRIEVETVQATETVERSKTVIEVEDGRAVQRVVTEAIEVPLFDEYPLFDGGGAEIGIHRAPRMVEVELQVEEVIQHDYAHDAIPEGLIVPDDAERVTQQRRKLNPEYDPSREYIPRADRAEWDTVGLMGKLRVLKGQPVGSRWIKMRDVSAEVEEWLVR